jgi:hypothetical protein
MQFTALDTDRIEIRISHAVGAEVIPVPFAARSIEKLFDDACHFRLGSLNAAHVCLFLLDLAEGIASGEQEATSITTSALSRHTSPRTCLEVFFL